MAEIDDIKESLKRLEVQLERERQEAAKRLQYMQDQISLLKSQLTFVAEPVHKKDENEHQAPIKNTPEAEPKPQRGYPPPPKPIAPTTRQQPLTQTVHQQTSATPIQTKPAYDWSQWEMIIGGNWLARIGIIVVALGLIFFMKFSFDNNLISPNVRILLSLLAGTVMAGFGESLFRRKYTEQAQALYAGSIFTFYTTILLAKYYPFSTGVVLENHFIALLLMVGTSVYAYALAFRFESQVIAAIGLVGAYLSPFLVGKSTGKMAPLLFYLTIISITLLPLTARKQWKKLFLTGILLAGIEPVALMLSLPTSQPFIESSWMIVTSTLLYTSILFTIILFNQNKEQLIEVILLPLIGILLPLLLSTHNIGIITDPFMMSHYTQTLNMGTATLLYYVYLFYLLGLAIYRHPAALYYLVPGAFFIILLGIPTEVKTTYWYVSYGFNFVTITGLIYHAWKSKNLSSAHLATLAYGLLFLPILKLNLNIPFVLLGMITFLPLLQLVLAYQQNWHSVALFNLIIFYGLMLIYPAFSLILSHYEIYGLTSLILLCTLYYAVKKEQTSHGILAILGTFAISFIIMGNTASPHYFSYFGAVLLLGYFLSIHRLWRIFFSSILLISSYFVSPANQHFFIGINSIHLYYLLLSNLIILGFLFFKHNSEFKLAMLLGTAVISLSKINPEVADPNTWMLISLIFLLYQLSDFLQNLRGRFSFQLNDIYYLLGTPLFYLLFSLRILKMYHEPVAAVWCLIVAALYALQGYYLYQAHLIKAPAPVTNSPYYRGILLYVGICISFITLGVFYLLKQQYITLAWAVECCLVLYFAYYLQEKKLKLFGLFLLTISFIRFIGVDSLIPNTNTHFLLNVDEMVFYLNHYRPFFSSRFIVGLATCGLLFYLSYLQGRHGTRKELALFSFVCGNILLLALLSTETAAWIMQFNEDAFLAKYRALVYSILWAIHATLLLILGFSIRLQSIRMMGLILFGIILAKVFAYDIWGFSQGIRIIAFILLGILLILSSLLYSRNKKQA